MREAQVDLELCDGCQECLESCRYDAIDMVRVVETKRLKAWVDPERCCGCHLCALECPQDVIAMTWLGHYPEPTGWGCGSRSAGSPGGPIWGPNRAGNRPAPADHGSAGLAPMAHPATRAATAQRKAGSSDSAISRVFSST